MSVIDKTTREQDISWSVIQPRSNGEENQYDFDTQQEATEFLFSLFADKDSESAYYGITIRKTDEFIRWTEEQVYIDHELNEFDADSAREYFVGV